MIYGFRFTQSIYSIISCDISIDVVFFSTIHLNLHGMSGENVSHSLLSFSQIFTFFIAVHAPKIMNCILSVCAFKLCSIARATIHFHLSVTYFTRSLTECIAFLWRYVSCFFCKKKGRKESRKKRL